MTSSFDLARRPKFRLWHLAALVMASALVFGAARALGDLGSKTAGQIKGWGDSRGGRVGCAASILAVALRLALGLGRVALGLLILLTVGVAVIGAAEGLAWFRGEPSPMRGW